MKRSDLHFGQTIFLRTLWKTESIYGTDDDLRSMVGGTVEVYEFDCNYQDTIKILHPLGSIYSVHTNDIDPYEPSTSKLKKEKPIKVKQGDEVTFDIKHLSV